MLSTAASLKRMYRICSSNKFFCRLPYIVRYSNNILLPLSVRERTNKMADIIKKRMTAEIEGDFVVFLIGMRINKLWKIHKWLPVARAMPRMLIELAQHKDMGLLGTRTHFGLRNIMVFQYWRSFEHLAAYAGNRDAQHFPAWVAFNKSVGSNGDVGI